MQQQIKRLTMAVAVIAAGGAALWGGRSLQAQSREWTTSNGDAQRSSWMRTDARLTKAAVEKGELAFLWKMKLAGDARQLQSLTQPILLDRLISHRGFKALAFVGTSGERVFAIDTDLARPYWETVLNFSSITPPGYSTWACPGGLIAAVTRPSIVAPPAFGAGGRGGRGGRSGGAVGEPGQGAPNLQQLTQGRGRGAGDPTPAAPAGRGAQANPAAPPAPGAPNAQGRGAPATGLGGGRSENVYVLGSDGYVRALNAHNGAERFPAVPFIPANARPSGLILADGLLYTSTSNGCGAVPNGVYAIDINAEEGKTVSWQTGGPNVAGAAGPTLGTDGTVYVATTEASTGEPGRATGAPDGPAYSSAVVALDPRTLKLKDWFSAPGADFNASPVAFRYKDRDLIVATANDGKLYVLDSAALGGADHKTPLHVTPTYTAPGVTAGVATWEDQDMRWILAPVAGGAQPGTTFAANGPRPSGAVVAFKLSDAGGTVTLEPAWASRDMTSPLTPVVFSGVVFAVSSGEHRGAADARLTAAQRAQRSIPAVLYALDPATGKQLWTSGKAMTSFARGGISASAGQVYVVTFDNTLYAFGIPMEH
jgi:outer membrane protein assembly factor BamB